MPLGLTDIDLNHLQHELIIDPQKGAVMPGTGGLRKLRFAFENRGKSGSLRVVYVDFVVYEKIYFVTAYPKSEKDNLSQEERNIIKKMIADMENTLSKGESR